MKKTSVHFEQDPETHGWVYWCDKPSIVGVAKTLEEAQTMAAEALGVATDTVPWTLGGEEKHAAFSLDYQAVAVG
jgi:predicted RNase H-like HicB family nuclease